MSEPQFDKAVTLWRCPACGNVEPNTSQSARYCGRTRACTRRTRTGMIESTAMERVEYIPAPCGLCGGYGAYNRDMHEPRPCIACGQEASYAVLMPVDVLDPEQPAFAGGEQRHGLRLIDGGS